MIRFISPRRTRRFAGCAHAGFASAPRRRHVGAQPRLGIRRRRRSSLGCRRSETNL